MSDIIHLVEAHFSKNKIYMSIIHWLTHKLIMIVCAFLNICVHFNFIQKYYLIKHYIYIYIYINFIFWKIKKAKIYYLFLNFFLMFFFKKKYGNLFYIKRPHNSGFYISHPIILNTECVLAKSQWTKKD